MKMTQKALALALLGLALQGCGGDDDDPIRPADSGETPEQPSDPNNPDDPENPDDPSDPENPDDPEDPSDPGTPSATSPTFEPSARDLALTPFPSDTLFYGTTDGSINVPDVANSDSATTPSAEELADPMVALNTMDGFGTTANLVIRFSGTVDPATLRDGLRIFETNIKNPLPVDDSTMPLPQIEGSPSDPVVDRHELSWDAHYVAEVVDGNTVVITPTKPFAPLRTHIVAVTDALRTPEGELLGRNAEYAMLQNAEPFVYQSGTTTPCDYSAPPTSLANCTDLNPAWSDSISLERALELEGFRQITNNHLQAIADYDGTTREAAADGIILSYSVTTQHVQNALYQAKLQVDASSPAIDVADSGLDSPAGNASLFTGTLSGIYQYIDPAAPNASVWEATGGTNLVMYNGFIPEPKSTDHSVPLLVSVPDAAAVPACADDSALPVVVFQHDLNGDRTDLAALADSLAGVCAVGVAIDLPKHGVMPADADYGSISAGAGERLAVSAAPGSESSLGSCVAGAPTEVSTGEWRCPVGDGFLNARNLANARDTLRQSVIDLHSLYTALSQGALTADELGLTGKSLSGEVHFVGKGFGAVVGVPFAAKETGLSSITLNNVGGGIARMVDGSPTLEPQLVSALESQGISKPSAEYEQLLTIAQALFDNVDPLNYTKERGLAGTVQGQGGVLAQEVIGSGATSCDDDVDGCPSQLVPNNVFGDRFGPAWGIVGRTGQDDFLPGQNPATTPVVLAGTDVLTQGSTFVPSVATLSPEEAEARGPLTPLQMDEYKALGLTEMDADTCGALNGDAAGADLVRFTRGGSDSLLDPAVNPEVTALMQDQMATWIASGGEVMVCDPNTGTADQVVRSRP